MLSVEMWPSAENCPIRSHHRVFLMRSEVVPSMCGEEPLHGTELAAVPAVQLLSPAGRKLPCEGASVELASGAAQHRPVFLTAQVAGRTAVRIGEVLEIVECLDQESRQEAPSIVFAQDQGICGVVGVGRVELIERFQAALSGKALTR
jgi:hypothetical protein